MLAKLSADAVFTNDFYRPANSTGFAPGDNPRKRGVQDTDRYRPETGAPESTPFLGRHRVNKGFAAGDNPRSRGVQESDRYRPDPILYQQISAASRFVDVEGEFTPKVCERELMMPETFPTQAMQYKYEFKRPQQGQVPVSSTAVSERASARSVTSIPKFEDGTTLFSFTDFEDRENISVSPKQEKHAPRRSGSGIFSSKCDGLNDEKRTPTEDPAATRRLFGRIIQKRRATEATTNPSPSSSPNSSHEFKKVLPHSTPNSSKCSLASQYGVPQGFKLARSAAQEPFMPDRSRSQNPTLASIGNHTQSKHHVSPFSNESVSTPKQETAWQRMVRESNERWDEAGG